jgi:hypothetical protein
MIKVYKFPDIKLIKTLEDEVPRSVPMLLNLAPAGTCKWQGPISAIADTGFTETILIPKTALERLGLGEIPVIGKVSLNQADSSTSEMNVGLMDVSLICQQHHARYGMTQIPVFIPETGDDILIGMALLAYYDLYLAGGGLLLLRPNLERWTELADPRADVPVDQAMLAARVAKGEMRFPPNVIRTKNTPSEPKRPEPYKRPPGPAPTPAAPGAFQPPKPPAGPKPPR